MPADSGIPLVLPVLLVALLIAAGAFPPTAFAADDARGAAPRAVRVVVWDEQQPEQKTAYDNFLGNAIADHLKSRPNFSVRSVKLGDAGQGVSDEVLDSCDVLVWWGHRRHNEISPQTGRRIVGR